MPLIIPGNRLASTGFTIDQSVRFDQTAGAYLQDPNSNAGDSRKKFTFSTWFKRGALGENIYFYSYRYDDSNLNNLYFDTNDKLNWIDKSGGSTQMNLITNRVFRDPAAFYHIVVVWDTAQAVSSERAKIYINGVLETSFSTQTYPSQNADSGGANRASSNMRVGALGSNAGITDFFDGYFAESHYSDNYAYEPSNYGEFSDDGIWIPIEVDISYGSAGFYFDYANASNLGANTKGKGNYTVATDQGTGLAAHDQMLDTPTNNFCVMSPIDFTYNTLRNGNLETIGGNNNKGGRGTMGFTSGKFYWEMLATTVSDGYPGSGVVYDEYASTMPTAYAGGGTNHGAGASHNQANWYKQSTSGTAYGSTASSGDILQYALDRDNNKIYWGVNGTYRNSGDPAGGTGAVASSLTHYGAWMPFVNHGSNAGTSASTFNFGQDGTFAGAKTAQGNSDGNNIGNFYYSPPSGFLALCTKNLGS